MPQSGWQQVEGAGSLPTPDINDNVLTSGASSTLLTPEMLQQLRQQMQQRFEQLRSAGAGNTGGLIPGATPASPKMPLPPTKMGVEGAIPQGPFGTIGERKRADDQAMLNGLANIVNTAREKIYQKKVQDISHNFETFKNAMTGLNEGMATGNQEMVKTNAGIINKMALDPKINKEFSKAFDVNLNPMAQGKGKEKPNPANDALKATFFKAGKDYQAGRTPLVPQAQMLMKSMPQTLQPDPRYQAYLEGLQKGAFPKAGEQLTFQKDLLEIQQKIQNNEVTNATKEKIAKLFTDARDRATQASLFRTAMTIKGAQDRMDTMQKMWTDRANKLYQGVHERTQAMQDKIKTSGSADDKKIVALVNGLDKMANSLNKQLEDARKAHDVGKMGELTQKLESLGIMQQTMNAEIARRLNLNPEDFDQEQFRLDDQTMRDFQLLFPEAPPSTEGGNAANQ